ncbi:uncharacterized protein MYCFIDRAFT_179175 [Pseudocercospora fijiensis CIRAD86]|uniref:Uncharacterized protein n=1 Tax=Pseudocercospora fijiensis (strain CIRAD86) TaxID=383855 RepID=M3AKI7_PSEFD|nr:uncharacterized protein MYCFIDRAFT_179175 [Pseudocercospora fijiensis CIRAD86]EME77673.1 hypothetical protein MYCFIDRAFT_179175 [Pseudocercospora fijiensis CIRAD86]
MFRAEASLAHCRHGQPPASIYFRGQLLHCAVRRTFDDAEDPDINKVLYEDDLFSYKVRKVVSLGTALHEAASTGRPSVIQMLIRRGADVSIRDPRESTALERCFDALRTLDLNTNTTIKVGPVRWA